MARRRCGKRMSASRKTAESRDAYVVEPISDSGSFALQRQRAQARSHRNRYREISFRLRIDEHEADVGGGFDLVLLGAVDVRDGKDQACFSIGPCLDGSRAQSSGGLRRQHAHVDVFDDIPDARAATLLAHVDAPFVSRLPACEAPLQPRLAGLWRRSLGTNYARWAFQPRRIFEPVSVA